MKRDKPLARKAPSRSRSSGMKRGGKLAAVNPARQKKRRQRYAALLAKARKGPGWKAAVARAEGQCEWRTGTGCDEWRCPTEAGLDVHHKTYARFGHELPEDLVILCKPHHALIESQQYPHRHANRTRAA